LRNWAAVANGVEAHLNRLKTEVIRLEGGELRHAIMQRHGRWEDRTNEAIHEKRNLIAALEVMLKLAIEQRELVK
jgi:adenylylsulfate kinase-like enzyme